MGFLKTLLFAVGLAYGQLPNPQALIGASYRDFSGGYVDAVAPSNLQPNQSPNLLNVKIDDPAGSLKPREGYLRCGITPSGLKPTVLYEYNSNSSGNIPRFIVSDSSTVWQTQDCITFTTVTTRMQGGPIPSITTVRDKIWIVNRSTHAVTWNGSVEAILDGRANTPSPAPPRFNYIEFWNERVWGARTTTNPSGVYFSDLTDTLGNDLDPSTGTLAWPAENVIQVAQENGSPIYGIKVYRNALFVFKENGIWRIDFNGPFDITVSKTLSSAGTRYQTSIVEHDNLLYFAGLDGFYAFDGDRAVRVSDAFRNKFNDINQTSVNQQQKTWDTTADFDAGTFSSTTANDISGTVTLSSISSIIQNFENSGGGFPSNWSCIASAGLNQAETCGLYSSTMTQPVAGVGNHAIGAWSARLLRADLPTDAALYIYKVDGTTVSTTISGLVSDEVVSTKTIDTSSFIGQAVFLHFWNGSGHLTSSSFTAGSNLTFQYERGTRGFAVLDNFQSQLYFSSGVWTSEIYNVVSVSSYSTLEATAISNGGSIAYSVRVGTDATAGGIQAKQWVDITPGSLITGTTSDIYVQVKATFTAVSARDATPQLQDITVNTVRGTGSSQAIYSFSSGGNLYITAATGTATTNNLVFVRSRLPLDSWTLYDLQLGPMTEFNDRFYAGSSTNSFISRMNYGTNDNGGAINWYWESREETYDRPNIRKYLMELNLEFRKGTESALTAGYSRDGGTTYTTKSASAAGSGRGTARFFVAGSNSLDYRFKVSGSTLDGTVTVLGLTGWARPAVLRE